jgi:cysteine desulfuration protein SufE
MYETCLEKQRALKEIFASCSNQEAKYQKIMEFGKALAKLDPTLKTPKNEVSGCQSKMYLHTLAEGDKLYFQAESDALISAGLAALLIKVYSGETAETILKCPPSYLEELGINTSLTPSRANGLYSIHLRMKQEALKHLMSKQ